MGECAYFVYEIGNYFVVNKKQKFNLSFFIFLKKCVFDENKFLFNVTLRE